MKVFLWHVHGSWTTGFVQGDHEYLVPVLPDRDADGRGRAQTWDWPDSVREVTPAQARDEEVDVLVLQRPRELDGLAQRWLGRRPGRDVPTIYLEHSSPQGRLNDMRHPAADRDDLVLAHVTHFNDLFWDAGSTRTTVIEHGIVDPGLRFTGELDRAAVVINEPGRRARVTGTDLLGRLNGEVGIDLFGMGAGRFGGIENLRQDDLHDEIARRRVYLHPVRWTSLGLSLLEAMHLGLPVVALATTEVVEAVPRAAGVVSNRIERLRAGLKRFARDPDAAREAGLAGRAAAVSHYRLDRFLADWDALFEEVAT